MSTPDARLAAIRALCAEADSKTPDDFRTGQEHLPRAFREVNYHDAFMWLAGLVNRIEEETEPDTAPAEAADWQALAATAYCRTNHPGHSVTCDVARDWATDALAAPDARSAAFRDAEHAFRRAAEVWEVDGTDPCRVRVLLNMVDTLEAWADGRGTPDGPASMWRAEQTALNVGGILPATIAAPPAVHPETRIVVPISRGWLRGPVWVEFRCDGDQWSWRTYVEDPDA